MQNNQDARLASLLGHTIPLHASVFSFKAAWIETPIAPMIAISSERELYLLTFVDSQGLDKHITRIKRQGAPFITPGVTEPLLSIQDECTRYFNGTLTTFKTPLALSESGTPFQCLVWNALQKIPYGKVISYAGIAGSINKPTAHRAVANANHANPFCLIIPCHRVIYANGSLGGYASGPTNKIWLLNHERRHAQDSNQ